MCPERFEKSNSQETLSWRNSNQGNSSVESAKVKSKFKFEILSKDAAFANTCYSFLFSMAKSLICLRKLE